MASAILLCAGFGTRLKPLTDELPKPLVPIGDRSILEHAASRLAQAGFREMVVNMHHLSQVFAPYIERLPIKAQVIHETEIRGTAGGVSGAREYLRSAPILVWNGDIFVDPPLDELLADAAPDHFCFGVAPRALGEGTIGLDDRGRVVRLRGERFGEETQSGDYVGVLALGAATLAALPESGCLFADGALPRLRAGGSITSVPVTRPWTDAGEPAALIDANRAWLRARNLDSFVAPGAELASGVRLLASVVCAGARVGGEGAIERSLVCPGAVAVAPLADAIVTPSGRVVQVRA
ncbi:MAG TPA: NDP-sugar synthase [Polyangiaceae bacterium]|jgi:mannose-1-phosphate guanylyltransferase|nr:NDP-sugar synthase [Polyangiaceae bacterium]